jgi:HEAT repeat protein
MMSPISVKPATAQPDLTDAQAPLNIEAIRLQLVQNNRTTGRYQLSSDAIHYLLKALEHADKEFSNEIEDALTRVGTSGIPMLLKGLKSSHNNVRSTCAMVLVRIGRPAVAPLLAFYERHAERANLAWVIAFVLGELGVDIAAVPAPSHQTMKHPLLRPAI